MAQSKKTAKPKKAPKPFFKERKEFVKRLLDNKKSSNIALDMKIATQIFERFDNDIDFLSKVKPLFKMEASIKWFLTKDGVKFLDLKYKEFKYKPKKIESAIDLGEKVGDDVIQNKKRTIRQFLDNE
jgi:hypothetical protein